MSTYILPLPLPQRDNKTPEELISKISENLQDIPMDMSSVDGSSPKPTLNQRSFSNVFDSVSKSSTDQQPAGPTLRNASHGVAHKPEEDADKDLMPDEAAINHEKTLRSKAIRSTKIHMKNRVSAPSGKSVFTILFSVLQSCFY